MGYVLDAFIFSSILLSLKLFSFFFCPNTGSGQFLHIWRFRFSCLGTQDKELRLGQDFNFRGMPKIQVLSMPSWLNFRKLWMFFSIANANPTEDCPDSITYMVRMELFVWPVLGEGSMEWFAEAVLDLSGEFQVRFEIYQVSICFTSSLLPYTKICGSQLNCIFNNGSTRLRMICLLSFS